ncbi:hypothetical protein GNI_088290, partial [Gregarina niphandrodes]
FVDSLLYSADRAGRFCVHDVRCPSWRAQAAAPLRFADGWHVNQVVRLANSATLQLVLTQPGGGGGGLAPACALTLDALTCRVIAPPLFFGPRDVLRLCSPLAGEGASATADGALLRGLQLPGAVSAVVAEGTDAYLLARDREIACVKEGKVVRQWPHHLDAPVDCLFSYPKVTDLEVSVPYIRGYASATNRAVNIT